MNLIFAYHNGDAEIALKSAKAIAAVGNYLNHEVAIICPQNSQLQTEITAELSAVFAKTHTIQAQDGFSGWPLGPNQMFFEAACWSALRRQPWYFWETDCVPMKQGWLDELEKEYKKEPAIIGDLCPGGKTASGLNVHKAIIGSAIYPPNLLEISPLARNLGNYNLCYKQQNQKPDPWDIYCRNEFMRFGRDTERIKTYWRSVKYQQKSNFIMFYAEDPEAQQIQSLTCPTRVVSKDALVVHGCKDGSLHDLIIAKFTKKVEDESAEAVVEENPKPVKKRKKINLSPEAREKRRKNMEIARKAKKIKALSCY